MSQSKRPFFNKLLLALPDAEFARLEPHLTPVTLAKGEPLIEPYTPIAQSWFVESGIVSVVASTVGGHQAEVGIVGHEGMVDLATVHGADLSPLVCFVQIAGSALRMPAAVLREQMSACPMLRAELSLYAYSFMVQASQTALANASFGIEERLARWLLLCHARLDGDEVAMTHEFLSLMLNVRRAGVTTAIQSLEKMGFIRRRRGVISIADRRALEQFAADGLISDGGTALFLSPRTTPAAR